METFYIPSETDFKRWIKEAVSEYFQTTLLPGSAVQPAQDNFLTRKEVAVLLGISLVTLTDWVKRGLPSHKQRGRVYFVRSEVLEYIRQRDMHSSKLSAVFHGSEGKIM